VSVMFNDRFVHFSRVLVIGLSVVFCLMAVLRAQAWLNGQAEMSLKPADAASKTDAKMIVAAPDETVGPVGKFLASTTVADVDHASVFGIDQEDTRGIKGDIRPGMLVVAQPSSDRCPGQVEPDTPGAGRAEGKKNLTTHVVYGRLYKARRTGSCGLVSLETVSEAGDASVASVSVHRRGREPAVYRVPKEQ